MSHLLLWFYDLKEKVLLIFLPKNMYKLYTIVCPILPTKKMLWVKELSLCPKLKFSNPYIFTTGRRRPLIFQTYINRILSLKYLRSTTLGCKDIRIRKFEFVTKTQFLCILLRKIKTRGATKSQSHTSEEA